VPILIALVLICLIGTASAVNVTAEGNGTIPWGTKVGNVTVPVGENAYPALTWDGTYWYCTDFTAQKLYKLYENGTEIQNISLGYYPCGSAYDPDSIGDDTVWVGDYGNTKCYQYYTNNLTEYQNWTAPANEIASLAWGDGYLWIGNENADTGVGINKTYPNGTLVESIDLTSLVAGFNCQGLAYDPAGYLWAIEYAVNSIFKLNLDGTEVYHFVLSPGSQYGDGELRDSYFWRPVSNNEFYQITVVNESTAMSTSISPRIVNSTIVIGEDASCTQEDTVTITNPSAYNVTGVVVNYTKPAGAGDLNKTSDSIASLSAGASTCRPCLGALRRTTQSTLSLFLGC